MMKYLLVTLNLMIAFTGFGQGFYDMETVQTIEIEFAESNWDQLLDAAYASESGYILAQSVTINGEVFDSVGVKYKGNSTYRPNQVKNPFHIELDTYKDHDYEGYKDIKLSNVYNDPSFVREVLSYQVIRQYMVAPQSNYANVYVNGNLMGLYSNSEAITKTFTGTHFGSKGNTFVKCNPPDGAGPQSNDFPNLVYLGEDSTSYYDAYELKTDFGWSELIDLCDSLGNHIEAIEQILDVDKALWMIANNNVLVNLDSYIGAFAQNYYLYRDDHGRFLPVIWDLNESFGKFSRTGTSNLNNTTAKQQMSHLLHENDSDFPLVKNLLAIPMYKRMYLAHFKTILLENFDNGMYYDVALMLQELIDESVQNDNNKFYTYDNFTTNLDSDINSGGGPMGGSTPGIANLMNGRSDYLLALSDFTNSEPSIVNISLSTADPVVDESLFVTAEIAEGTVAYLGYRSNLNAPFTRIQMADDGTQNDGLAGDGIFGVELLVESALVQYYIYAENDDIGKFSPVRAEHEYHTFTATTSNTVLGDLVINEFMASNDETVADQDGEFEDWIELYNNGTETLDLQGHFLSDDAEDLMQWEFPEGISIAPDSYLTIWADNDTDQEGLHANFKLSSSAESVFLVDPQGEIVDEVSYFDQDTDVSYGRYPNGTGDFQKMQPTFGAENMITTSIEETEMSLGGIVVYPNPVNEILNLKSIDTEEKEISIYTVEGMKVYNGSMIGEKSINTSCWTSGVYIVRGVSQSMKIVIL